MSITPHCSKSSNTSIIKSEGGIHTITNDITAPLIEIPVGDLKTIDIVPITSQCSMNIKSEHVEIVIHTTTNDIFDREIGYEAEDECTTTSKKILTRRRRSKPHLWPSNIRKEMRNKGEPYITVKGKAIGRRSPQQMHDKFYQRAKKRYQQ